MTVARFIANFLTKRHWRGTSRVGDIEIGLCDLVVIISIVRSLVVRSLAIYKPFDGTIRQD